MSPDPRNADTLRRGSSSALSHRSCALAGESDRPLSFAKAPETPSTSGATKKPCSYLVALIYDLYYDPQKDRAKSVRKTKA